MNLPGQLALLGFLAGLASSLLAAGPGDEVFVLFNANLPESAAVARHYATSRAVPTNQVYGLPLPTAESISRTEFREQLQNPLWKILVERGLFAPASATGARSAVQSARIRYLVLCYGVPLKILRDPEVKEPGMEQQPVELRRNEAAVDNELAVLPLGAGKHRITGVLNSPFLAVTNSALLHPTNGLLLVARLDGPTGEIALGLVDKAARAERDGLWGRAYFDARENLEGDLALGNEWLRRAAEVMRRQGFETEHDTNARTFSAGFPLSDVGIYAGWHDEAVSGPFTRERVEFLPGAVAYHLHSFSAFSIRTAEKHWVGPMLAKGATATMGSVDEPYLQGTPDLGVFFHRLTAGWTFGEAAWAAQRVLSWQVTVVGDPLYRPFGRVPAELHADLLQRRDSLVAWSRLRVVNLNLMDGTPLAELIRYLEAQTETPTSAVLLEKLGSLHLALGQSDEALAAWEKASAQQPSPQQRVRLLFTRGELLAKLEKFEPALNRFREVVKLLPPSPELSAAQLRVSEIELRLDRK